MTAQLVLICEDEAHAAAARILFDRLLYDRVAWSRGQDAAYLRAWRGLEAGARSSWSELKRLARERNLDRHFFGAFTGEASRGHRIEIGKALLLFSQIEGASALVLLRDDDSRPGVREALVGARDALAGDQLTAIGVATHEIEAWFIRCFSARDGDEAARLQAEAERLGFSPVRDAHRLDARRPDTAPKSAKRVLALLTAADRRRRDECLEQASLEALSACPSDTGLGEFVVELAALMPPLYSGRPST